VLILGGGHAGMSVTAPMRAADSSMALVEARELGERARQRGAADSRVRTEPTER